MAEVNPNSKELVQAHFDPWLATREWRGENFNKKWFRLPTGNFS